MRKILEKTSRYGLGMGTMGTAIYCHPHAYAGRKSFSHLNRLQLIPELCTSHDCQVSSQVPSHPCRVSSHRFFQGPSPESSVISLESRVESWVIILESESSRVIAKVSRVMSRVIIAQFVVSSRLLVKWKAYLTIWNDHCTSWCCSFYLFWVTLSSNFC